MIRGTLYSQAQGTSISLRWKIKQMVLNQINTKDPHLFKDCSKQSQVEEEDRVDLYLIWAQI